MEITPTLPQIPDAKLTVTSKFNSYNCDMSFVKNAKVQSLTSDNTRCFLNISWRHFVSTLTSLNPTSLAAPKANHIPCCNKNLFIKTPFDLRHLTSSSTSFYYLTTISEGTNNSQRGNNTTWTHIRYTIFLAEPNKLSLVTNKSTSPTKIIQAKNPVQKSRT